MIPRYSRPAMAALWEPNSRFRIWLDIEAYACDAQARLGLVPETAAAAIRERGALRGRPHRRHRGGDEARRHRLSDQRRRARRPGGALPPSGPDLVRCTGHLPRRPARPRRRHSPRRHRRAAGGAGAARLRAQADADHRPQPRHPRRAADLRGQARRLPRRVAAQPGPASRPPAPRSRPAPSPAPSAPSPTSTWKSRPTSPTSSA